jgi:outer membrane biosynthesis protein TonB
VEPDILQTGEVAFLSPESRGERSLGEKINATVSVLMHVAVIALIIFAPKIFAPHVRTSEEEDLARRQMTVLLPPGALDSLKPSPRTPPAPHERVNVDPRVIRKVAPTPIEKPTPPPPIPVPEPPKRELPSAPAPQPNATPPPPQPTTPSKGDLPKTPLKLDSPEMPVPQSGLILPKQSSPGDAIKDAARQSMGKMSAPRPIGGGGQIPGGGQGGGGGRGSAGGTIQLLTDTQGVDFNDYLHRVYVKVKQNWFSVMPPSVQLGERGDLSLRFRIMADGSVPDGEPIQVYSSGKEPLDRAAFSSIRASNPFPPLPGQWRKWI